MGSKYDNTKYIGFRSGKLVVTDIIYNNGTKWVCKCDCNGNEKEYLPSKVYLGRTQSCGCNKINNQNKYGSNDYIGKVFNDFVVTGFKQSSEKYDGVLWECTCRFCGNKRYFTARHVVDGRCTRCSDIDCKRKRGLTHSKYDNPSFIGQIIGNLEVTGIKYGRQGLSTGVIWECKCLLCGNTCEFPADAIMKGNNSSCGCVVSLHENWLENIFKRYNLEYRTQVHFDGLVGLNHGLLRFDFAIIDTHNNKKLIEYDGAQHREDPETSNCGWDLDKIIEHDRRKNEFCKNNNIELVRISKRFKNEVELEKYLVDNNII
jgi:hypothetical protein